MFQIICHKYNVAIISVCWLFFLFFYIKFYGIVSNLEGEKYIKEAQNLLNGQGFSAVRFWFYSVTIIIIAAALKLKIGFLGVVIIQSLLNLFTLLYFYKSLTLIFGKFTLVPLILICITISFTPYSSWNVYYFIELFFPLCLLIYYQEKVNNWILI